jgi:hypothetical protein
MSRTSHQKHSRLIQRALAPAAAVLVLAAGGAAPSSAREDPGPSISHSDRCSLQRVGTQFVRCDDLTGNGVPAPSFIPER